jgi:hypothetical protein
MKILAWNLGHQTIERPIRDTFAQAVMALAPDVLSLNEYVHGPSRPSLLQGLAAAGLPHWLVSERLGKNNQVLIASRWPIAAGDLRGPTTVSQGGESNFLHAVLPSVNLEVVGVRAPAYTGIDLHEYWGGLLAIVRRCKERRILFIGDLNTDPDSTRRSTSAYLRALRSEHWTVPRPTGDWSYISPKGIGTCIDHAVVAPALKVLVAEYIQSHDGFDLASIDRCSRISDHAPLAVHLETVPGAA